MLENEWQLLQNQYDSYEKYSLIIKLLSISLFTVFSVFSEISYQSLLVILLLWLQDSIWKNFQSRIETRLITLENLLTLATENNEKAMQFHTEFQQNRASTFKLLKEYGRQALKPTVAYPHLILFVISLVLFFKNLQ
jgi:hypothetical protein